jgi:chromosomal replication initiation ATPase DnaA
MNQDTNNLMTQDNLSLFDVLVKVCEFYKLDIMDVSGNKRTRELLRARQMYYKLSYHEVDIPCVINNNPCIRKASSTQVGFLVGKDHATVLSALKKFQDYCDTDKEYLNEYKQLKQLLWKN